MLKNFPNLKFGLSRKPDGSMKVFADGSTSQNRENFLASNKLNNLVVALVSNSKNVKIITFADRGKQIPETDGLITALTNLFLSITVADCFPVYLYDPVKQVIGLAHAGWRGIAGGIINNTLSLMVKECGCLPQNILALIGPGIQKHHFEVKEDVVTAFKDYPEQVEQGNKNFVDLPGIINRQLLNLAINPLNIEVSNECTYCLSDQYFSFRRDKPAQVEAMVAYIGLVSI